MREYADMTEGPLLRSLFPFIVPMIGGSLFQQLYNTADFIFVGNFIGSTEAAAVGASSTLITCCIGLFSGISAGISVVASHAIGAKNPDKAGRALHSAVLFGLIGSIAATLFGFVYAPAILSLLRTPESVIPQAVVYMRIYILSLPMLTFYNMVTGGMRAYGDSRTPFLLLAACGFLNVAMDYLFVILCPMGVAGVSIATCITQSMAAILAGFEASRKGRPVRFSLRRIRIDGKVLGEVLGIGMPAGIQTIIIAFSNAMVQYYINDFGKTAVAAFAAYFKAENFIYLPILAFGQAAVVFSGQNTGAGQFVRLKRGVLLVAGITAAVVAGIAGTILLFSGSVFTVFIRDPSVSALAAGIAGITFPFYWIYAFLEVYGGAVRGMGHSFCAMAVIIVNLCVIRVGLLALFDQSIHTIGAVAAVYPITWALAAISFVTVFYYSFSKSMIR